MHKTKSKVMMSRGKSRIVDEMKISRLAIMSCRWFMCEIHVQQKLHNLRVHIVLKSLEERKRRQWQK